MNKSNKTYKFNIFTWDFWVAILLSAIVVVTKLYFKYQIPTEIVKLNLNISTILLGWALTIVAVLFALLDEKFTSALAKMPNTFDIYITNFKWVIGIITASIFLNYTYITLHSISLTGITYNGKQIHPNIPPTLDFIFLLLSFFIFIYSLLMVIQASFLILSWWRARILLHKESDK